MLKRAASNAYSWWRASNIRTKQSKWLDGNLEEMENTVKNMLKLIEPDADSFAKRAELYFKMRPELISFVEDVYKAYKALAERYDHISGELHKANHIIATSFPEEVQYAMLEDEDNLPRAMTPINPGKINKGTVEGIMKKKKKDGESSKKKGKKKKGSKGKMDKERAQLEINKLQKKMLALQTEKEFVKSSYESGMAKYWEIEKQYMEMHEKVRSLEEEYGTSSAIEDNDARVLMAEIVLKSCEDTIVKLQVERKKALEQEKLEAERTEAVKEKLKALRGESCQIEMEYLDEEADLSSTTENTEEEVYTLTKTMTELKSIHEKIREYLEKSPENSVIEIAEKIEELANKVITMEITDSSRAMQVNSLNAHNDELEKCLQSLEEDKVTLSDDADELNKRLKEAGDELIKVQAIRKTIQEEETNFREDFDDAWQSLNGVLEMLQPHTPSNNACTGEASLEEENLNSDDDLQRETIDKEVTEIHDIKEITSEKDDQEKDDQEKNDQEKDEQEKDEQEKDEQEKDEQEKDEQEKVDQEKVDQEKIDQEKIDQEKVDTSVEKHLISNEEMILDEEEATLKLQQPCQSGLKGKQKILLAGYRSILQNYKETKIKLSEVERKYEDYLEETRALIEELGELKIDIAMKDEEIRLLKRPMRQLTKSMKRGSIDIFEGRIQAPPVEVLPFDSHFAEAPPSEASSVEVPPDEASLDEYYPAEAPPVEDPPAEAPGEAPPVEVIPAEAPPADEPPAEETLADEPPAEEPPAEAPSVKALRAKSLHIEAPPAEEPPAEDPLAEEPPAEAPSVKPLRAKSPHIEAPPAEEPPAEETLVEEPPDEAPSVKALRAKSLHIEAPPAEEPPAEEPLAEEPPAEAPSIKALSVKSVHIEAPVEAPAVESSLLKIMHGRKKLERKSNAAAPPPVEATSKSIFGKKKLERKSNTAMETWSPIDTDALKKNLGIESPTKKDSSGEPKVNRKSLAERFPKKITPFEVKFRNEIDGLLDEKLEFWLRFSASFCQIQEIKAKYEDLEADIKARDNKSQECSDNIICNQIGKYESAELSISLRELKTELHVWLEQGSLLKEDLHSRYSALSTMQEEILSVLNEDSDSGELLISPYKAERFQGEVINMKLENSKVGSELKIVLDQAKGLYDEIEAQLRNLGPFGSKNIASEYLESPYYSKANVPSRDAPSRDAPSRDAPSRDAPSRDASSRDAPSRDAPSRDASSRDAPSRDAPLRNLLFGVKPKKAGKIQHGKLKAGLRKMDF